MCPRRGQEQPGVTKGYFVKNIKNLTLAGSDVGLRKVTLHREKELWVQKKKGVLWENVMSSRTEPRMSSNGPGIPAHLLGTHWVTGDMIFWGKPGNA